MIMGDVLPFKAPKLHPAPKASTLCREGHHKWKVITDNRFDVKQGKLVTVCQCQRCGTKKNKGL